MVSLVEKPDLSEKQHHAPNESKLKSSVGFWPGSGGTNTFMFSYHLEKMINQQEFVAL